MTLHIFNPEHDIALASGIENFTPPRAGRLLRHDLGFLPALWAQPGDTVLADDPALADALLRQLQEEAGRVLGIRVNGPEDVRLVSAKEVRAMAGGRLSLSPQTGVDGVEPWGWDAALRSSLRRIGVADSLLPGDEQLRQVRRLSHRSTAARLMDALAQETHLDDGVVGEVPAECTSIGEVEAFIAGHGRAVLKAPWSSSGRGVRFCGATDAPLRQLEPWLRGVLNRQGSVMAEPYYDKVRDFGMEFLAGADGTVAYCGLSLFHTDCGAYKGNIVATEAAKREMMEQYLPLSLVDKVRTLLCRHLQVILQGQYQGPLGVDMMVCVGGSPAHDCPLLLHPCVEINLRRTMGHAALALTPSRDDIRGVMHIDCSGGTYGIQLFQS